MMCIVTTITEQVKAGASLEVWTGELFKQTHTLKPTEG